MKLLLVPVWAWCVSTSCFAVTEDLVLPSILIPVSTEVDNALPEKAERDQRVDRLEGLRKHLGGLAETLEETGKVVDEMARQRDVAREEAKQNANAHRMAMAEAASLRKQLAEAKKESERWKAQAGTFERKMQEGVLAHEELKNFRGELRGALKEFQALKGDIGKARSEFQDPVERAELKKEMAVRKLESKQMGSEMEAILQEKKKGEVRSKQMQVKLEEKLNVSTASLADAKARLSEMAKVRVEKEKALADAGALRKEVLAIAEKNAKLKLDLNSSKTAAAASEAKAEEAFGELRKALEVLENQVKMQGVEQEATKEELARAENEARELQGRLAKPAAEVGARENELQKLQTKLKQAEESKNLTAKQGQEVKAELAKTNANMEMLKKAKTGLEELLFRKTDELRGLKARVRQLEKEAKEAADAPPPESHDRDAVEG